MYVFSDVRNCSPWLPLASVLTVAVVLTSLIGQVILGSISWQGHET
jgi:hypothetical protein